MKKKFHFKRRRFFVLAVFTAFFFFAITAGGVLFWYFLPKPRLLENFTFSSAVYDREGSLLRLSLSRDDKYRLFVPLEEIPLKARQALLLYEDRRFYSHFGIDPLAVVRAFFSLFGGRRQGASTLSMQLARLIWNIDSSRVPGKLLQMFRAVQLERHYSKDEILEAYFNLAPYGENVEGIGAASLVYFHTDVARLTLPEILSLIVVPQNPGKRVPSEKNTDFLEAKERLSVLWREQYPQDSDNKYLSLPVRVYSKKELPFEAPHLTTFLLQQRKGKIFSTILLPVQQQIEEMFQGYLERRRGEGIRNGAVMVVDWRTMETVALIGSGDFFNSQLQGQVDGTRALRSPGSVMKPFIYALALEEGIIHPMSLLRDIPSRYAFYSPENFDHRYQGVVNATEALIQSLNIPAVDLQQKLKKRSFYDFLKQSGVPLDKEEEYYGLALALGGYEISLQDVVRLYAVLARKGVDGEIKALREGKDGKKEENKGTGGAGFLPGPVGLDDKKAAGFTVFEKQEHRLLSKEAAFLTLDMLFQNTLPRGRTSEKIAWKTGTSHGARDAWTVGISGPYVIGVWVGNFDGKPNQAFIGRQAAAPFFFEVAALLQRTEEYGKDKNLFSPEGLNVSRVKICRATGDIAADTDACPQIIDSWFIPGVSPIKLSEVYRKIPVDKATGLRACRHEPPRTVLKTYAFWPSDILESFEKAGIALKLPPAFGEECETINPFGGNAPQIIYPASDVSYIVRRSVEKDGKKQMPFKASADADAGILYWFLDEAYMASSQPNETFFIPVGAGDFSLKVIDSRGRVTIRPLHIGTEL